ncbi:MAG: short-chain dehydrogenase [Phycisphaeraceae bacterium]|nr:short-chain dehydrogenase [Phycisphaeraceae bacterium]
MPTSDERTVQQLFDLSGRTALITGGTGWLGGAMSRALAEAGASVVISSRDRERASDAASKLPSPGGAAHHGAQLDHMDGGALEAGFSEAVERAGAVDILINNGLDAVGKDLTNITFEEFARHQVNNAGYFILARRFRDHVVGRGAGGSVVNIGSMYGQVASYPDAYEGVCVASPVAYHALKGGTIHMTRHLAAFYARDNVRVNCLSPGPFPSEAASKDMVDRLCTKLPMKRMGLPYELKGALILLASDAGSYITGQNLTVDGGWTAW